MNNFEYASPTSLKDATSLLGSNWGETEILAGGTDVLSLMKEYVSTPKRVVNIKAIPGLNGIKKEGDKVSVGAMVTLQEQIATYRTHRSDLRTRHSFRSLYQ